MKSLLTLLVLLGVSACSGGSGSSAGGTQTGGGQPLQSALQGAWERPGYGTALRISGGTLTRYDFTAETCVLSERNSLTSLSGVSLQDDGQTFSLQQTPLAFPERYIRRSSLPPGCG
ncbi:MAG: hypothetical protein KDI09_18005, partial [Halioglobus sp.]|nr:hypothetical protein [Halioglobus sp.]